MGNDKLKKLSDQMLVHFSLASASALVNLLESFAQMRPCTMSSSSREVPKRCALNRKLRLKSPRKFDSIRDRSNKLEAPNTDAVPKSQPFLYRLMMSGRPRLVRLTLVMCWACITHSARLKISSLTYYLDMRIRHSARIPRRC